MGVLFAILWGLFTHDRTKGEPEKPDPGAATWRDLFRFAWEARGLICLVALVAATLAIAALYRHEISQHTHIDSVDWTWIAVILVAYVMWGQETSHSAKIES